MENITHTLLGVAIARAGLRRAYGPGTTTVLTVASNLCDIDILSAFAGLSTAVLVRRTLSHSIVGAPVLCVVAAYGFHNIYRHLRFRVLVGLCLLGCAVHILLDWLNSYGVALLAPFSSRWFELGAVFVADPILIGLLILPPAINAAWRFTWAGLSPETAWKIGLALVVGYVGGCVLSRDAALRDLAGYVQREGLHPNQVLIVPEPFGPHRWTGIVRSQNKYDVFLVRSATGSVEHTRTAESMVDDPRVERVQADGQAARLGRFFKAPLWQAAGNVVTVQDLRFSYQVVQNTWDPFLFRFWLAENHVELREWTPREVRGGLFLLMRDVAAAIGASREPVPTGRP